MNTITRLIDALARTSGALAAWLALVIVLVMLDGVLFRFVINRPLQWSDELAVWSMIWLVWVGAIGVMRRWDHVHIPMFLRLLPLKARMFFIPFAKVLTLVCLGVIVWYGVIVFQGNFHSSSPSTGVSTRWIKLAIPVGAGMMALCAIYLIIEDIARILRKDYTYFEKYGALDLGESDTGAVAERASARVS